MFLVYSNKLRRKSLLRSGESNFTEQTTEFQNFLRAAFADKFRNIQVTFTQINKNARSEHLLMILPIV